MTTLLFSHRILPIPRKHHGWSCWRHRPIQRRCSRYWKSTSSIILTKLMIPPIDCSFYCGLTRQLQSWLNNSWIFSFSTVLIKLISTGCHY
ncbi:hypothetical protein F442_14170 [Phytophthora nicotianae P10297]|uniref:Uncharacterized protein n=1 Tax=Phytophthora nicotianae P10297 TaxID=1317064 RepID=W2YW24_PHYNI|nr:hypothetical protein F442_14170 [Phytophthora nicotianae P10297]